MLATMRTATILFATLLTFLPSTTSHPNPAMLAGGPAIVPIPSTCTVTYPLPHPNGYMPSTDFRSANTVYYAFFDKPGEPSAVAKQCFEQCHGFTGCLSAFLGYRVPVPKGYYGSEGGELSKIGCLLFNATLAPDDFVPAPGGQYRNSSAANIACP